MVGPQRAQMFGRADSKSAHPPTARTQVSAVGNAKTSGSIAETEISDLKITMKLHTKLSCMNCAHDLALRKLPGMIASCVLTTCSYRTLPSRGKTECSKARRSTTAIAPSYEQIVREAGQP